MQNAPDDDAHLHRSAQVAVRLRPHERELLESAARARRERLSDLVREASLSRARQILVEER